MCQTLLRARCGEQGLRVRPRREGCEVLFEVEADQVREGIRETSVEVMGRQEEAAPGSQ
jgi:hypothetical protein